MQIITKSLVLLCLMSSFADARVPYEFTDGSIARASEINANFTHMMQEIERSKQHFWSAQPEHQIDCTLDSNALTNALAEGHINIFIASGSCYARGLTSQPVLSVRGALDVDGKKLVTLDSQGQLLDLSGFTTDAFYFRDVIFKGALRSGASWGWLSNIDVVCDVTDWSNYFGVTEPSFALFSYGGLLGVSNSTITSDADNLCSGLTALGSTYTSGVSINAGRGRALVANPGSSILASNTSLSTLDDTRGTVSMLQAQALFFGQSIVQLPFDISTDSSITFAGTTLRSTELNSNPTQVNLGSELVLTGISSVEGTAQFDVTDSLVNVLIGEKANVTLRLNRSAANITSLSDGVSSVTAMNNSEIRVNGVGLNLSIDLGLGSWLRDFTSNASVRVPSESINCAAGLQKYSSEVEGLTCR